VRLGRARTRTALAVTPNPVALGGMLTLTATVTVPPPAQSAPPGGTVRFYDGHTSLGTAAVGPGSVAALSLPAALPWSRSYRAAYLGDGEHLGSISTAVEGMTFIASVAVPDAPLSAGATLELASRNPVVGARDGIVVRLTLPSAQSARLEMYDVRGRLVLGQDVGALGPGVHQVTLRSAGSLAPGVHLLRLAGVADSRPVRVVVL
jgi:hypothetical protein